MLQEELQAEASYVLSVLRHQIQGFSYNFPESETNACLDRGLFYIFVVQCHSWHNSSTKAQSLKP